MGIARVDGLLAAERRIARAPARADDCGVPARITPSFRMGSKGSWMLASVTGMGLLERAHSYKDKIAKGIAASHGASQRLIPRDFRISGHTAGDRRQW